jgi:hypothetical protein
LRRAALPVQYLASVHNLDGMQLAPPHVVRCVILEPNPPSTVGEWGGHVKLDPAIAFVFAGELLELRVSDTLVARIILTDANGTFTGDGPPPGYPAWKRRLA